MNAVKIYKKALYNLRRNNITLGEFKKIIEPLKDVETVVHAHWICQPTRNDYEKFIQFECSVCHTKISENLQRCTFNYYYGCGAKMDEDNREEKINDQD